MKRIVIAIISTIAILAMMVSLSGCDESANMLSTTEDFILVGSYTLDVNNEVFVYYDVNTKVMYQFIDGYKTGGSTAMFNSDGTMTTYNEETNVKTRIQLISKTDLNVNNTVYRYYDTVSKTLYQYVDGYQSSGVSVMRNPDGSIATYSE